MNNFYFRLDCVVYGFLLLITSLFDLIVLLVFVYDFIMILFCVCSWFFPFVVLSYFGEFYAFLRIITETITFLYTY